MLTNFTGHNTIIGSAFSNNLVAANPIGTTLVGMNGMITTPIVNNQIGVEIQSPVHNYNMPQTNLIQFLKNSNYINWESELFKFFYGQNTLYIFPKMEKIQNLIYLNHILINNLTLYPLNSIIYDSQQNVWYIQNFSLCENSPSDNEIINFCEQMRNKNLFLNLNRSNFLYTNIGIFIKNPDCFLMRPFLYGKYFTPLCPIFHQVVEDFVNGIHSEDKLYWCPSCQRHYHKSEINFTQIKQIIKGVK